MLYAILAPALLACSTVQAPDSQATLSPEIAQDKAVPAVNITEVAASGVKPTEDGLTAELVYDLLLANIAFQAGEVQTSADALIRAADASDDVEVLSRAVRMAIHSKRYPEAVTMGLRWVERSPEEQLAYTITALAAVMDGQGDVAFDLVHRLMEQDPEKLDLRFQQFGEVFLQYADNPTAVTVARQLAEAYPERVQAWLVVAGIAQKNKDFKTMAAAIDQILRIEPDNRKAAEYKLLVLNDDIAAQTEFATQFLKRNPKADEFRLLYAKRLLQAEHMDESIAQLKQILKHDKGNTEVLNLLALLYQSQEDYAQASKYFKRKLEFTPDDDRTRLYLASSLQQLERYDEAQKQLELVQGEHERFNAQRQTLLLIEQSKGEVAALDYLDTLHGVDQEQNVQLLIDRESLFKRVGRTDEANKVIDDAIARYPGDETLIYHRALNAVEQRDLKTHEADMKMLLARDPDNAHYNNTLGYSLLTLSNRLEEAGELIDRAHQAKPKDPYILDSKGWLEYKRGNLEAARDFLLQAFSIDQDAEIAAHLGELYWALDEPDKAREYWGKGDKIDAQNQTLIETKARFLQPVSAE